MSASRDESTSARATREVPALAGLDRSPWRMAGVALAYALAWLLLVQISHRFWFLPAGLRLGALGVLPSRRWGWLLAGEWAGQIGIGLARHWAFDEVFLGTALAPWLIYAVLVRLVRGPEPQSRIDDPRRMLLLLGAGVLAAACVSPLLQWLLVGPTKGGMIGAFSFLYGDFLGQLVLAPLIVLSTRADLRARLDLALARDVLVQLLVSLLVFWAIHQQRDLERYILLLAFAPIFFVAFRHGWEGAAVSVAVACLLVQGLVGLAMLQLDTQVLQLSLAVVGGGGLVLGAASSELRRSHERLAQRHRDLAAMNQSLTASAGDLRAVSQRLVRLEEQGQRELAVELDYELGRSIHALSTRISLAFRDVRDDQMLRLLESMREQVREMQDSLRRVLRQLRPQALDTHGLREALDFGPLRDTLEDAGIAYETAFSGRIEAHNDDAQTTIYRICQAAVRDASRSPSTRKVQVRVDVLPAAGERIEVRMQLDIEASPFVEFAVEPQPLAPITDRVLAQQGAYWVEALAPGVRHLVRFEDAAVPAFQL
jgi:two-component system sensor histidine kinase UhpB